MISLYEKGLGESSNEMYFFGYIVSSLAPKKE